ncbi:MAG: FG-GAP repeat domain-containing protein [Verrucomicrobiia bacterium]
MKKLLLLSLISPVLASAAPRFEVQLLNQDNIESCAVGDLDKDGDLDIVAGEHYFLNPEWEPIKFRSIEPFGKDYMQDNGDFLYDVNGDGLLDVIAGQFTLSSVLWFENPGENGLITEDSWTQRELVETGFKHNEMIFLRDMDGDKIPEYVANSWNAKNPMLIWKFKGKKGNQGMSKHIVSESGNGHGQGFGDINGDGHEDIVFMQGWYERPAKNALGQSWKWHKDFTLPHASCPILVKDLNGDGRNDLIWGDGHNYGLYWHEQLEPRADGTTAWKHHLIDKKISQLHALAWEDLNNDGKPEIITGKRYYAHSGKDRGAEDEIVIASFQPGMDENGKVSFKKEVLHTGQAGTGLYIQIADLNEDGNKEIIVPGKSGTHILWNKGTLAKKPKK